MAVIFLLAFWAVRASHYPSGTEQYCEKDQAGKEECATYDVFFYPFVQVAEFINTYNGVIVALSGCAVAAFTFTLWRSTEKLWLASGDAHLDTLRAIRAAEVSAAAAALNAQTVIGVELPRLEVVNVTVADRIDISGDLLRVNAASVVFRNHGKNSAHIIEHWVAIRAADILPGEASYPPQSIVPARLGTVVETGRQYDVPCARGAIISKEDKQRVIERQTNLWIYGYVLYRDFLDGLWRQKFCLRFDSAPDRMRFAEDKTYPSYTGRERYLPKPTSEG